MRRALSFVALLGVCIAVPGQEAKGPKSGPAPGTTLPAAFDAYVVHGKVAAQRQHCLVCEHGLSPVVAVFAREAAGGKDEALQALIKKLDAAVAKHQAAYLAGFVVVLSDAARSSVNNPAEAEVEQILKEANDRNDLIAR